MRSLNVTEKEFNLLMGRQIKEWRINKSLTQDKLAETLGISRSSLAYIETGKSNITLFFLFQLKLIFNLDDNIYQQLFDLTKTSQHLKVKSNSTESLKDSNIISNILDSL